VESHPGRPLVEHLNGVKDWGSYLYEINNSSIVKGVPVSLLKNYLVFHDIGKATLYFQEHLKGKETEEKLKNHALISAVLFLWYSINTTQMEENKNDFYLLLAFMSILRHHSNLSSMSQVLNLIFDERTRDNLRKQWESIDKEELGSILIQCGLDEDVILRMTNSDVNSMLSVEENYLKETRRLWRSSHEKSIIRGSIKNTDLTYYFILQNLFSFLTDSDKSDIAIREKGLITRKNIDINVRDYMKSEGIGSPLTPLNRMRMSAFEEVEQSIRGLDLEENRVLHLTLPTGFGKTLISFNFAFELKRRLNKEKNVNYRVIYVLPFTSIIDQNAKIMENILLHSGFSGSNYLIKHHHLEPIDWTDSINNQEYNYNMASVLFEGWNSEVVVTSFVQFFETLIGWTNRRQRKFNKLNNSIVLIDEIQAIPAKYYELTRRVLKDYARLCNSYVVAMTATQPKIFENDEIKGLCDPLKYFTNINRIVFENRVQNPQSVEDFAYNLTLEEDKKYLFILNTINSAKQLFKILKDLFPERRRCFLSAHVVPKDRLDKIRMIKEGCFDLVVSTQVVEAGVDIDFDIVYRDFAPLPSLIQSAGRANREGLENGRTIIVKLVDGLGKPFANHTYKGYGVDLKLTEELINQKNVFAESELHDIIEQYFYILRHGGLKSMDESYALLKGMSLCIFDECDFGGEILPVSSFRLIDDDMYKFPVFVELDEHAIKLWEEYTYVLNSSIDRWEKKNMLSELSKKMSEYVINVGENHLKNVNIPPEVNDYLYISNNQVDNYYNPDTGFGSKDALFF